jgi:predicted dehydrogenase
MPASREKYRVLVVGCGRMGASHARAYRNMKNDFEIVGLVSRGASSRRKLNQDLGDTYEEFTDFNTALSRTKPDAVCISTYTETHSQYSITALEAGCHVFLEKPLAHSVEAAQSVITTAQRTRKKLVVGYILQVHPSWQRFVQLARQLGKPLVMRMNLNQQLSGANWLLHKNLLQSTSPLVDCGVHYVDVMCQMTGSRPLRVNGICARLADDITANQVNYGQLQVSFEDGSIGWYEAGWGPMISETACFVKDVIGPRGSISICRRAGEDGRSADMNSHVRAESLLLHHAQLDAASGEFVRTDEWLDVSNSEPDHDELCRLEQEFFLHAIRSDLDLSSHLQSAIDSLRIVFAAESSFREGRCVELS